MSPLTSTVDEEYQRARFMLCRARQRVVAGLKMLLLLLPVLVVLGAGPVVAAGDQDVAALRQDHLRAAEDVGAGEVVERRVAAAGPARGSQTS